LDAHAEEPRESGVEVKLAGSPAVTDTHKSPAPDYPTMTDSSQRADGAAGYDEMKTGTTVVGITTSEGVVVAADRRASAGNTISHKDVQKIEAVHPRAVLTLVGSVSGAQALVQNLEAEVRLHEARRGEPPSISALATITSNMMQGGRFSIVSPLLAGVDDDGSHLYSLDPAGSVLPDEYTATGSGMQYALGLLEDGYRDDLSNDEGTALAVRAVRSAVERDTSSGNGVTVAVVTADGVEIESYDRFEDAPA
jgi:proteasome beta subunit